MKKLVLVHGRAQEGKDRTQLRWTWIKALEEGLAKNSLKLPVDTKAILFPFYGDRLDEIIAGRGDEPIERTRGSTDDEFEIQFKRQVLDEIRLSAGLTDQMVIEASGDPAIDKGILNWKWLQSILRAFDRYVPGMSGTTVNMFTHDVYVYLHQPGVRDEIDKIVRQDIPTGEECVVVGHSLGAIVTFGILRRDERDLKIAQYITVGAPLALRAIQSSFNPLDCPRCVSDWFNARDSRDVVALHPLERPHFNVSCNITNKSDVDNFTANRHGIIGYLSDPVVSKKIYEALLQ